MAINDKLLKGATGGGGGGGLVPSANFKTVLYDGNGSTQNISNVGFKPDFIWIKARNASNSYHPLHDTIRGPHLQLRANLPNPPFNAGQNGVTAFNDSGFSLKDDSAGGNNVNGQNGGTYAGNPAKYVSWNWKFGGNANTFNKDGVGFSSASAAGLTAGTTAPSASSVNTAAGHSMVKVTTASGSNKTVPHGLGVKPDLVIWKRLDSQEEGWTFTDVIPGADDNNGYLILNAYNARANASEAAPTTTVVTQPTTVVKTYMVYMFASKVGFSKIDKYTGTGSLHNVELGFEPGWVIIKRTDASGAWMMFDNKRNTTNPRNSYFNVVASNEETTDTNVTTQPVAFTTTGMVIGSGTNGLNGTESVNRNNGVYLYYAIAADPDTTSPVVAKSFNVEQYEGTGANQRVGSVNTLFTKYAVFNGSSSYIQTGFTLPADSTMSFSFWLRTRAYLGSGDSYIWSDLNSAGSGASRGLDFRLTSAGAFTIDIGNGSSTDASVISYAMGSSELGKWVHLATTINGTAVKLYKNGEQVASATSSVAFGTAGSRQATLGRAGDYTGSAHYNGSMDQIRVFTSTLAASDITTLYNETQATASTLNYPAGKGCIILYEFDGNVENTGPNFDGTPANITFDSFLFKPDLSIIRNMDSGDPWGWFDTQRGVLERIQSSSNAAEASLANSLTEFNNGGFTVGNAESVNTNNETYTSYNFKMLDNNNNAPVQFAAGANSASRSSLVSANPSAGMSIVLLDKPNTNTDTYNHGLSAVPTFIILKKLNATDDMYLYTPTTGNTSRLSFNNTNAVIPGSGVWGGTTPTASLFTLQNQSGGAHVAYCFHSVSQFSSFGTYNGNSGTQTIATGFQPDFLMVKGTHASGWRVLDSERVSGAKKNSLEFQDAGSGQQIAYASVTFLSTGGFRFDNFSNADFNATNRSYIYWAMKIN